MSTTFNIEVVQYINNTIKMKQTIYSIKYNDNNNR